MDEHAGQRAQQAPRRSTWSSSAVTCTPGGKAKNGRRARADDADHLDLTVVGERAGDVQRRPDRAAEAVGVGEQDSHRAVRDCGPATRAAAPRARAPGGARPRPGRRTAAGAATRARAVRRDRPAAASRCHAHRERVLGGEERADLAAVRQLALRQHDRAALVGNPIAMRADPHPLPTRRLDEEIPHRLPAHPREFGELEGVLAAQLLACPPPNGDHATGHIGAHQQRISLHPSVLQLGVRWQRIDIHHDAAVVGSGHDEADQPASDGEDAAPANPGFRARRRSVELPVRRVRQLLKVDLAAVAKRSRLVATAQRERRQFFAHHSHAKPATLEDLRLVHRRRPRHAVSLALAFAAICAIAPAAPAGAARHAPCLVGQSEPICSVTHGKVNYVDDGDTIDVDLLGDGTHRGRRVRVTGIQAMEQTVYAADPKKRRGECHSVEAAALVDELRKLSHGQVRLAAIDPNASSRGRLRRSVAFLVHGQWLDLGRYLISRGAALAFPNLGEYAWNASYNILQAQTAATGIGLWDTDYCGPGPDDDVPLKLWVNWDADGDDSVNNNGEWIEIENQSPVKDLPLAGWWVRDSDLRRFRFPSTAHIPPLGSVRVYVGAGPSIEPDFHWGLAFPAFENATYGKRGLGDGAYLFDPQGDMRAWMLYPCRYNCTNPLQDALTIKGQPRGKEYVTVSNVSSFPIDLHGYELTSAPHAYAFGPDSTIQPGETMRIDTQGSTAADTRLEKHMDEPDPILGNNSDSVQIRTFDDIVVACDSWGGASCEGPRSLR